MNENTCSGFDGRQTLTYRMLRHERDMVVQPGAHLELGGIPLLRLPGQPQMTPEALELDGRPVVFWQVNPNVVRVWPKPSADYEIVVTYPGPDKAAADYVAKAVAIPGGVAESFKALAEALLPPSTPEQRMALIRGMARIQHSASEALLAYLDAPPALTVNLGPPPTFPADAVYLDALTRTWGAGGKSTGENGR